MAAAEDTRSTEVVDISPSGKTGSILKEVKKQGVDSISPWSGTKVFVHYTGWLEDGSKFDSSRDRDGNFSFTLGEGMVIKGWDIGVATMVKGEVCVLTIKPEFAYGKNGAGGKIPGDATLKFEVELIDWEVVECDVTGDKGVMLTTLKTGEGSGTPEDFATCKIHFRGSHEGVNFEEKDVEFIMGEGADVDLLPAIEQSVRQMKKHERARIVVQPQHAGSLHARVEDLPSDAVVEFEICLLEFEPEQPVYELSIAERKERAAEIKLKALPIFKTGDYKQAVSYYERMSTCVDRDVTIKEEEFKDMYELRTAAHLNSALCYIKLKDFTIAKLHVDIVIEEDPSNVKALYRRAEAFVGLQEPKLAITDLKKLLSVQPNNNAAIKLLETTKNAMQEQKEKEKALYQNMFKS